MQAGPQLKDGPIHLSKWREECKNELVAILIKLKSYGRIALVLDPKLSGPVGQIIEWSTLKESGVDKIFLFQETTASLDTECENVVYLTYSTPTWMKCIADHIHYCSQQYYKAMTAPRPPPAAAGQEAAVVDLPKEKHFSLIYVPGRSVVCDKLLEEEGVWGIIQTHEFPLYFVPWDNDILSMELDHAFKDIFLEDDITPLYHIAKGLIKLQDLYGEIPNIKGKGKAAAEVADLMDQFMYMDTRKKKRAAEAAAEEEAAKALAADPTGLHPPQQQQQPQHLQHHVHRRPKVDDIFSLNDAPILERDKEKEKEKDHQGGGGAGSQADLIKEITRPRKSSMTDNNNNNSNNKKKKETKIGTVILFDRVLDMLTPMCTPLTYEALVDEIFRIKNSSVELEESLVKFDNNDPKKPAAPAAPAAEGGKPVFKKVPLTSADVVFSEIRDLNFSAIGEILHNKAVHVRDKKEEGKSKKSIHELSGFVKELGKLQQEHQALQIHINVATKISQISKEPTFRSRLEAEHSILEAGTNKEAVESWTEYLGKCIVREDGLLVVLRMLVMLSYTGLLTRKDFDHYRREFLQTFGYNHICTLLDMERLNLINPREKRVPYSQIKKTLRLILHDVNEKNPNDIAFVYSGYAPISVRWIESAEEGGWRYYEMQELDSVFGPTFEYQMREGCERQVIDEIPELARLTKAVKGINPLNLPGVVPNVLDPMPVLGNLNRFSVSLASPLVGVVTGAKPLPPGGRGGATTTTTTTTPQQAGGGGRGAGGRGVGGRGAGGGKPAPVPVAEPPQPQQPATKPAEEKIVYPPVTLVFFIGGVTYTEIAALRWLSKKGPIRYIIATTKIINGDTLLEPLVNN